MVVDPGMPDEQLALRSSRGDREAFADLYARYFQGIYDLIFRMVRDPEIAADLAQNCFISAWGSLQKRTVSGNVRAWLYAIARNTAINEIRRKKRWGAVVVAEPSREDSTAFEGIDTSRLSNPEDALEAKELVDLVWESAAALGPKDYSLLDLHLRKDLAPGEIAANLGLPNSRVHVMLSRVKSALEESVGIALLTRRGRRDCPQLNEILSSRDSLSRDVRMRVRRHIQDCSICDASRRRFVAPAEIFSAIALTPVSAETTARIWSKLSPLLIPGTGAIGGGLAAAGGRAAHWWAQASAGVKVATVAVLGSVVVALPVGVALLVASGGSGDAGLSGGDRDLAGGVRTSSSATRTPQGTPTARASGSPSPTAVVAGVVSSPEPTGTAGPTSTLPVGPTPTGAATSRPTAAGATPTPTKAPSPTPTPPPSNQADVEVLGVDGFAIGTPVVGLTFQVSATAYLRNNGGAQSAPVDATFAFSAPADCLFPEGETVTAQVESLSIGFDKAVNVSRSVTCSTAVVHTFGVDVSAAIASPGLTDPDPTNNTDSDPFGVGVNP